MASNEPVGPASAAINALQPKPENEPDTLINNRFWQGCTAKPTPDAQNSLTPTDQLDQTIVNLCTRISTATYELLLQFREFDERDGRLQWGLANSAEWLAWRCDLSMTTALDKVRVAHALRILPLISTAFAAGELSYTKVRELTRVAVRDNEEALLMFALQATAVHVAERCRELRMGNVESISTADRTYANRSVRLRRDQQRGMMTITIDLPLDAGELVEKALDNARDDESPATPEQGDLSWAMRQADAFVNLVNGYLSGDGNNKEPNDNYLVTIHVDQTALAGTSGRSALPLESVKRLCCDQSAIVITEDDNGEPLAIGRESRIVPTAIARAVARQPPAAVHAPPHAGTRGAVSD